MITLHALVAPPSDSRQVGTDVMLSGVRDADVETAKRFFLRYSGERLLESTDHGQVLARADEHEPARIYVKGLFVAEEPNFLFSYNITKLSAALRRALNRERSNVGRGAYSDRVKAILIACRSTAVAGPLAADLNGYTAGRLHDELAWRDVTLHACRVLQTNEKVVFVTTWQMATDTAQLRYAMGDGYRTGEIAALAKVDLTRRKPLVLISETMRLSQAGDPVLGVWEAADHRIVIRRDQLNDLARYAGTLLHEIGHMISGTSDGTLDFETELSRLLGMTASAALRPI